MVSCFPAEAYPTFMAFSVVMPALEMAQETGKLVAWRKKEGETVSKGEPLLEVETDKAVLEVEAQADGILAGVRVHEGAVVPVGETIAWIVRPGEVPPPEAAATDRVNPPVVSLPRPVPAASPASEQPAARGARISPKARRLAKEHGVETSQLRGSGSGGEILAADILAAVAPPPVARPQGPTMQVVGPTGRLMAERTTESWTSVPHFYLVREVDAGALVAAREKLTPAIERAHGVKVTHTDFLVALLARALLNHPQMNASWTAAGIHLHAEVNLGIAMAVEDGVVVAVIPRASSATLGEIARQRQEMTERARAGRLRPSDVAGATFTLSNLGMYRVDAFSAIIPSPQAAILAVGTIADRVVPVDGQPGIRPMMTLTLSSDHRVVDGRRAARFLNELAEALQDPENRLP
jgi:pyruvate dehydrogenase E2 component (dihydrolipoamide acetyltransferase)